MLLFLAVLVLALIAMPRPAAAAWANAPTGTKGWCTFVSAGVEACEADPQSACRAQLAWRPNILYGYKDKKYWWSKQCHWSRVLGTSFAASVDFECLSGYTRMAPGLCVLSNEQFEARDCVCVINKGGTLAPQTPKPISILDGTKSFEVEDFGTADAALRMVRHYSSRPAGGSGDTLIALPLGFANWRFGLGMELHLADDWSSGVAGLATPQGGHYRFTKTGSAMVPTTSTAYPVTQTDYTLEFVGTMPASLSAVTAQPTQWIVRDGESRAWHLETARNPSTGLFDIGRPTRVVEPSGLEFTFQYADGALLSISDSYGRTMTFTWLRTGGASGTDRPAAVSQVSLPDATTLNYAYSSVDPTTGMADRLAGVERRQGAMVLDKETYDYGDDRFPTQVTGVRDRDGNLRWSVTYDDMGRALTSSGPGGAEAYSVAYGASGATFTRTVTTPLGKAETYTFTRTSTNYNIKLTSVVAGASPNSPAATQSNTYTGNYLGTATDAEGRVTGYTRDTQARPTQVVEAQGTALARTLTLTWHGAWNAPTETTEPGLTTTNTLVGAASAGGPPEPTYAASQTFAFTGAAATYTVPAAVTSATVRLWGGAGGNGNASAGAWSGAGGYVEATFAVAPGDVLKFEVAGGGSGAIRGDPGGAGGWPDGGPGGKGNYSSGGGGGSTRFYINNVLKAVAGGGGGSGGYGGEGVSGAGGGASGRDGDQEGGTGGTQTAGGYDSSSTANVSKTGRSIVAFPGVQQTGGWGSSTGTNTTGEGGGGGGGGYWGGGGGGGTIGYGQPGGGGSSWIDPSATSGTTYPGFNLEPFSHPPGQPNVARGVNSQSNGVAVAGGDGYAMVGLK